MPAAWRHGPGESCPGTNVFPGFIAFTILVLTSLLGSGCGAERKPLSTAPSDHAEPSESVDITAVQPPDESILAAPTTLGGPLRGLDAALLARFSAGQDDFEEEDTIDDGLGPVFNEASCATCHTSPTGGTTGRAETRFGRNTGGTFDPLTELGGSLLQDHAIGAVGSGVGSYTYVPEQVPSQANVTAQRITTPLFGLGLVDAVPDQAFLALARIEARFFPSTAGTPNLVTEIRTGATRVGRFGWKAQVPTLHQFSGDAYLNEMGVTNPEFPDENPPQGDQAALAHNPVPTLNDDGTDVDRFADFMTLLGPPPRGALNGRSYLGGAVFRQIGCANCHTPTLFTGPSPVRALSHRALQPFSDFLLHDMGTLGDGIVQGQANGRQMRTAPLWGLSARTVFLHDGRAHTPQAAIEAHAGQGAAARDRFARLGTFQRAALLAFLQTL